MTIDNFVTPSWFSVLAHKYTDEHDNELRAFLETYDLEISHYMTTTYGGLIVSKRAESYNADSAVKMLFAVYGMKWRKVWHALKADFPLTENYDRIEETYTATENGKETVTETPNGATVVSTYQDGKVKTETTLETAPYNDGYTDTTKTTTETTPTADYKAYTKTEHENGTNTKTETEHTTVTKTVFTDTVTGDVIEEHKSRIHGNIGVTTAAAMITEALQLYAMQNFVPIVCGDIADMYTIGVWGCE